MKITDEEVLRSFLGAGWRLYWHSSNLRWYIYTKNDRDIVDSSLNAVCEKLHEEQKKAQANIIQQARARDAEMASALRSESSAATCEQGMGCPADPPKTSAEDLIDPSDLPGPPEPDEEKGIPWETWLLLIGGGAAATAPYWLPSLIQYSMQVFAPTKEQASVPAKMVQTPMMGNLRQAFAPGQERYTVSG